MRPLCKMGRPVEHSCSCLFLPPSLMQVRDLDARADLGVFPLAYSAVVPPHDARVFRVWQANGTEASLS